MRADPRTLVKRLTPAAKRHLERAVALAVEAQHVELLPEHVLGAMLDDTDGDASALLTSIERSGVRSEIDRTLSRARCGGARPVLGDTLVRWLEDAWLLASLGWGDASIRSGALLVAAIDGHARYFAESAALSQLSTNDARARLTASTEEGSSSVAATKTVPDASGESPSLSRFTTSFTAQARDGRLDPVLGREREIRSMVDILCRRRKNNPILVGEPGVGKTALVEGLAIAIARGEVPEPLRKVEILALDLGLLEAGASVKGELESRLTSVIREVRESVTPIVLFIDEAHTLVGGAQKGGVDVANLLKPALARGELRTIAATTWAEYKKYFEKDAALERRFQPVKVDEPSEEVAIAMLRGLRGTYEAAHGVIVRDEAIEAAVRLSSRFLAGRQLPDKCVDLLDTAAARVRVSQSAPPMELVRIDAELASLGRHRDALARDRVDGVIPESGRAEVETKIAALLGERAELEARVVAQREALARLLGARRALSDASAEGASEALRRGCEIELRVAREAFTQATGDRPLVSAEVDASAIATTIEGWTGIPVGSLQRSQADTLLRLEAELDARVLGQPQASRRIAEGLRVAHSGMRRAEAPLGVFLLVGPSGVGKTETAHALADVLFGGARAVTTINLSEYQEKHTVSRLVGSPPGYVGYGEGGKLTEAVRQRPHSVVLLDECEKADLEVMNVFYQLFDRGTLADGEGRVIDFKNTVILLTSNLASDRIATLAASGVTSLGALEDAIRPTLSKHFAPALLARMSIVPYLPIGESTLRAITTGELARVESRIAGAHGTKVRFSARVADLLIARCTESEAGVRHLRAMLERHVLAPLAADLLAARRDGTATARVEVDLADDASLALRWG
jgi:type VI secretion system protein VasG